MRKEKIIALLVGAALLTTILILANPASPDPVTVTVQGALPEMSLDQKIYASEIILIGEIKSVLPSKWNTLQEVNTKNLSPSEVNNLGFGIITDAVVTPRKLLKGSLPEDFTLRVRRFTGTVEHVTFANSQEPIFQEGQVYLFLLIKDYWTKDQVDPGYYLPVNAGFAVFHIEDGKAASKDSEWAFEELVAYIEASPWALTEPNIPESDEAREIIEAIEIVVGVESKAGHDFGTGNLSSVFVNDPRFVVLPEKLEYTRHFTGNPRLESPGYLDYKIAYYNRWREGIEQNDNQEWTKKWGPAFAAEVSPVRDRPIRMISIKFAKEFATVHLYDGLRLVGWYLVKIDGRWYVAGEEGITTRPEIPQAEPLDMETPVPDSETSEPVETPFPEETSTPEP